MKNLLQLNPFRCRMWSLHDRLENHITRDNCKEEIESFKRHGQTVPVLGRTLLEDSDYDTELIFGARRLFVARLLNVPLLVDLQQITDKEAIVAMDIENRQRVQISPYERGVSYARMLRKGLFASQEDLSCALQVSASQVSRLLKVAKLPAVVVAAFPSPVEICESWGLDILEVLEDPSRRPAALRRARAIAHQAHGLRPVEVYQQLISRSGARRPINMRPRDRVVKCADGRPLFRIRYQSNSIALLLPTERTTARTLTGIRKVLTDILQSTAP